MKKIFLLMIIPLLLKGCQTHQDESVFYLENEYYNSSSLMLIDGEELRYLENNESNFIAFVFMPMCYASALFYEVVSEFINIHEISMYRIPFPQIENTRMADAITYFPTIVIYRDGLVRAFLESDTYEHIPYYQSAEGLKSWLVQYIYFKNE